MNEPKISEDYLYECCQTREKSGAVFCDQCFRWLHLSCLNMSRQLQEYHVRSISKFTCPDCKKRSLNHELDFLKAVKRHPEFYDTKDPSYSRNVKSKLNLIIFIFYKYFLKN